MKKIALLNLGLISPQQADGVLKESELSVFLHLALLLDIVLNHLFVAVCADRADEIAVRPELAAPQLLFDFRACPPDFPRRQTFDDLHKLPRTIQPDTLDKKVNVVAIGSDFQKRDFVSLLDFSPHFFRFSFHFF